MPTGGIPAETLAPPLPEFPVLRATTRERKQPPALPEPPITGLAAAKPAMSKRKRECEAAPAENATKRTKHREDPLRVLTEAGVTYAQLAAGWKDLQELRKAAVAAKSVAAGAGERVHFHLGPFACMWNVGHGKGGIGFRSPDLYFKWAGVETLRSAKHLERWAIQIGLLVPGA